MDIVFPRGQPAAKTKNRRADRSVTEGAWWVCPSSTSNDSGGGNGGLLRFVSTTVDGYLHVQSLVETDRLLLGGTNVESFDNDDGLQDLEHDSEDLHDETSEEERGRRRRYELNLQMVSSMELPPGSETFFVGGRSLLNGMTFPFLLGQPGGGSDNGGSNSLIGSAPTKIHTVCPCGLIVTETQYVIQTLLGQLRYQEALNLATKFGIQMGGVDGNDGDNNASSMMNDCYKHLWERDREIEAFIWTMSTYSAWHSILRTWWCSIRELI